MGQIKLKLLFFLATWTTVLTANNIETYSNSRFSFSIDYPSNIFVNKEFPANGDGVKLTNEFKTVELISSGHYMLVSLNIEEAYKERVTWKKKEKNIELTYKVQKDNWFVLSGYNHKNKSIFYEKRFSYVNEKGTSVLVGYYFEYPIKSKEKYNKWIKVFNDSFIYPHSKTVEYKEIPLSWERTGEHHEFEGYVVTSKELKESFEVLIFMKEENSFIQYKDSFMPLGLNFFYDSDVEYAIRGTKAFVSKESNTMYLLTELPTEELPEYKVMSFKNNKFTTLGYYAFPAYKSKVFEKKYALWNKHASKFKLRFFTQNGTPQIQLYVEDDKSKVIDFVAYKPYANYGKYVNEDRVRRLLKKYVHFQFKNEAKEIKRRSFSSSELVENKYSRSFRLLSSVEDIGLGTKRAYFNYKVKLLKDKKIVKREEYKTYVYAHCNEENVGSTLYIGKYENNEWMQRRQISFKSSRIVYKDEDKWKEEASSRSYIELGNLLCGIPEFADDEYDFIDYHRQEYKALVEEGFGRLYRTRLKKALKEEKQGFAGKYIVTQWGCDEGKNGCETGGIIDTSTGKAIPFPFKYYEYNGVKEIIYKEYSSLIVFAGNFEMLDGTKLLNQVRFYELKNGELLFLTEVEYKYEYARFYQNDINTLGKGLVKIAKEDFQWLKINNKLETVNTSNLKPFMMPLFYKPDYGICYFVFEKEEKDFYVLSSSNGRKFRVKKEKRISRLTWNKFLMNEATGISEKHTIEYMYEKANKESRKIKIKDFEKSEILEVKGFWMKIKNENDSGWIEWRNEKKLLILVSLLC